MRLRIVAASAVLLFGLGGCAAVEPEQPADSESMTPSATPAPTPSFDPTVVPGNRLGLECDDVAAETALAELFGTLMPFQLDDLQLSRVEALLQDGVLTCRWGEGPYLDGPASEFTLSAAPYGRAAFDAVVAGYSQPASPDSWTTTQVEGVGDLAQATCYASDLGTGVLSAGCGWSIVVGEVWVTANLSGLPATEVDVTPVDQWTLAASPRADSVSTGILKDVAEKLGAATPAPAVNPIDEVPGCAELADWQALAASVGVEPVVAIHDIEGDSLLHHHVENQLATIAAANQQVRYCTLEIGPSNAAQRPLWISIRVLPAGAWLQSTGLWTEPGIESCRGWEGGPVCELATYGESHAIFVRVSGDKREGTPQLVVDAILG